MPYLGQEQTTSTEVTFVPTRTYVQRMSVLLAFSRRPSAEEAKMSVAARKVRRRYAKFLDANAAALGGYFLRTAPATVLARPADDQRDYAAWRLRNTRFCRQSFVWRPDGNVFCNLTQVCPFCWGRSAGEAWDRIAPFLFPAGEDGTRPQQSEYDLALTTRRVVHEDLDLSDFLRWRLDSRRGGIPSDRVVPRWKEVADLGAPAAYEVVTTRPRMVTLRGKRVARFESTISQLFAVRPDEKLGEFPESPALPRPEVHRIARPTRVTAAGAVARLCRYPRGLIVPARGMSAADHGKGVVYFLEQRHRRRLWVAYGGFYGNGAEPAEEKATTKKAEPRRAKPRKAAAKQAEWDPTAPPIAPSDSIY